MEPVHLEAHLADLCHSLPVVEWLSKHKHEIYVIYY